MLQIRQDQLEALGSVSRERFILALADEVEEFAPELARVIGKAGCRQVALCAEATAEAEGLAYRSSMRLLVQLGCVLGSEFTVDPQLPWVREILGHTSGRDEAQRTRMLHRRSLAYLDEVHGPGNRDSLRALRMVAGLDEKEARDSAAGGAEAFASMAARMFPEKHDYVGRPVVESLYHRAAAEAETYELGPEGALLLAALAFALGSGVARDPCYPWIARTLRDPRFGHGPLRTARLYRRVRVYARFVLAHLAPSESDDAQI
jgi:hypothetical protein